MDKNVAFGVFSFYLEVVLSEDTCARLLSHVRSRPELWRAPDRILHMSPGWRVSLVFASVSCE